MMGNYYGNMFGWGLGGGLMMILLWVAIIIFIVWIVREISGKKDTNKTGGAHYLRKLAFALGAISMTSWLSAFLLGMLRGLQVEFLSLLSVYIGVVIIAVISSQFMEWYYANRT